MFRKIILLFFILVILNKDVFCKSKNKCSFNKMFNDDANVKKNCKITDPNNRPPSGIEKWFTKKMFNDLFPAANLGYGPNTCLPYSYESFIIAARYFPRFGTTKSVGGKYNLKDSGLRDLSAFFAHAIQETGENSPNPDAECFFRGGFYHYYEMGTMQDGTKVPKKDSKCAGALYCSDNPTWPCSPNACYIGRGAIQISYNYNYGQFQDWLKTQNINVDLLKYPNLVLTKKDPPLALMASLWFYMTPQPPKPAMHDVILGFWRAGKENKKMGYYGPIFGPTSLIINNECQGYNENDRSGGAENRRIHAFVWFTKHFKVKSKDDKKTLTCKDMPVKLNQIPHNKSFAEDGDCNCKPVSYQGDIFYYQKGFYRSEFVKKNEENRIRCIKRNNKCPNIK